MTLSMFSHYFFDLLLTFFEDINGKHDFNGTVRSTFIQYVIPCQSLNGGLSEEPVSSLKVVLFIGYNFSKFRILIAIDYNYYVLTLQNKSFDPQII